MAYFAKYEMFRQLCRITSRNYYPTQGRGLHQSSTMQSKVAVVLSGSGVFDGSEVHESSAVLVHLSRREADISIFAPDIQQMHVIDHSKGEPTNESRNVLAESARIARGKISSLTSLTATNYDAVIFPGGFGAAKNLSSFATEGSNCTVHPEVERVLKEFHAAKRPIGLCCIAPVLVAKVIPGCEITIGQEEEDGGRWPYAATAAAIREMGATHVAKNVTDTHIDEKNLIVTSPAFMCETHFHEVFDGIGEMVKKVLSLAS